jgi:hypothetical protein
LYFYGFFLNQEQPRRCPKQQPAKECSLRRKVSVMPLLNVKSPPRRMLKTTHDRLSTHLLSLSIYAHKTPHLLSIHAHKTPLLCMLIKPRLFRYAHKTPTLFSEETIQQAYDDTLNMFVDTIMVMKADVLGGLTSAAARRLRIVHAFTRRKQRPKEDLLCSH